MWEPTVGQGVNVNIAHTFEGGAGNGWVIEELNAETDEEDEEEEVAVAEEDDAWLSELAELASISSSSPLVEMVGSAVLVLTAALRRPDPAQVLAAAESIKKRAAKLSELPDGPIRDWYERNLRKGEDGMAEIIKGVLSKAQEVKDKDESFDAEVAKVLGASDYGDLVRAQFPATDEPAKPKPPMSAADRKAILDDASPEALAAAESIKKRVVKLSEIPDGDPIRDWFESNLRKGEEGVAEIIKGVLKSPRSQVADKDDDFKAEVAKVLGASDYGELVRAQFDKPAKPKPPLSAAERSRNDRVHVGKYNVIKEGTMNVAKVQQMTRGADGRLFYEGLELTISDRSVKLAFGIAMPEFDGTGTINDTGEIAWSHGYTSVPVRAAVAVPTDLSWPAVQFQEILLAEQFQASSRSFKVDDMRENLVAAVEQDFLSQPEFNPEIAGAASSAAGSLCRWVINMCESFRAATQASSASWILPGATSAQYHLEKESLSWHEHDKRARR